MGSRFIAGVLALQLLALSSVRAEIASARLVHAFYYLWYGTPEIDGQWQHWDHEVLPHWTPSVTAQYPQVGTRFTPPHNLHCPFYPLGGPYSSSDPAVMRRHFRELRAAGVGVAAVSWWGPGWRQGTTDTQGVSTDALLPALLEAAEAEGMEVAFHLEPYPGRNASSTREDLLYLMERVGSSPAVLRLEKDGSRLTSAGGGAGATSAAASSAGLPLFYVYDSYHIPSTDWAQLLQPGGEQSLRGSEADGIFVGLWLNQGDGDTQILPGGFDGFYTYFSSEAVSYGANPANWPALSSWAQRHGKLFIPSVGPGYDDSGIRPWNAGATRAREGGARYARWWDAALAAAPAAVSITSFNEWGEGTQIEAARVFGEGSSSGAAVQYESYGGTAGRDEWLYMNMTAEYAQRVGQGAQQAQQRRRGEAAAAGGAEISSGHSEL